MAAPTRFDRDYHARRLARANEQHRARARRGGVADGPVDTLAVFDRDNWVCGICGDAIDPAGRWQRPERDAGVEGRSDGAQSEENKWLPSLDHIVPLSRGGSHSMDNVRAAHALCNSWRGLHSIEVIRRERAAAAEVESFLGRRPAVSAYRSPETD
jgi:hypothetical protein